MDRGSWHSWETSQRGDSLFIRKPRPDRCQWRSVGVSLAHSAKPDFLQQHDSPTGMVVKLQEDLGRLDASKIAPT
jgi:hypothetical protein